MQAEPAAVAQDPIRTMSPGALDHARWALLDELATDAETLKDEVEQMRDVASGRQWPDTDTHLHLTWINQTMEALDALNPGREKVGP